MPAIAVAQLGVHWCGGGLGQCSTHLGALRKHGSVVLGIGALAWRASAKFGPPETDPRVPGLPRYQLVSQCSPSSVSLKNVSLDCGTLASSRTDSQQGFPPTCPLLARGGRIGAHASVAWTVKRSETSAFGGTSESL